MWLCKRDACPHWAVSQCHHGPNLSLCAAHTAVAAGPRPKPDRWQTSASVSLQKEPRFSHQLQESGSVSHRHTLVMGADGRTGRGKRAGVERRPSPTW